METHLSGGGIEPDADNRADAKTGGRRQHHQENSSEADSRLRLNEVALHQRHARVDALQQPELDSPHSR